MKELLFFLLALTIHSQLLKTQWTIESNETTLFEKTGLRGRSGHCSWALTDQYQNIELSLYEDEDYQRRMMVKVFLNYSINKAYPTYDGLAHMEYQFFEENRKHPKVKQFDLMPYTYFFNNTLSLQFENSTLTVLMQNEQMNGYVIVMALAHLTGKLGLLFLMINSFRAINNKLSMSFVYVLIGLELQAHIHVIKLFQASKDPEMTGLGVLIGLTGWIATLGSLLMIPRPHFAIEQLEGLGYYAYICSQGFLFSQANNILLYALSPILQIRFNIFRNVKNSVCPYAFSLYLLNIFFIYYIKGCPACLLRYPVDITVCIKATVIAVVLGIVLCKQEKHGPLLCARQLIQGKDFTYMEEINLSEGEEMMEEVCSICLQPLFTETLVEQVEEKEGRRVGKIMKTPCNHRYHPSCLREWLKQKNTCPLDNQQIPPCFD